MTAQEKGLTNQRGLIHLQSNYPFSETVRRLESALEEKGVQIFCLVDHCGEAAKVGLAMQPALLFIFGNPKAGTPLMIESPTLALDLPFKALVWENAEHAVWLTYNSTEYLRQKHGLSSGAPALLAIEHLLHQVTGPQAP